jgi:hypothetical protein
MSWRCASYRLHESFLLIFDLILKILESCASGFNIQKIFSQDSILDIATALVSL